MIAKIPCLCRFGFHKLEEKIRDAIGDSAPRRMTNLEMATISDAVISVIRDSEAKQEVRESEKQQSTGPQVSIPREEG